MPELVGEHKEHGSDITFKYTGDEVVNSLDDVGIPKPDSAHYTDDLETYSTTLEDIGG